MSRCGPHTTADRLLPEERKIRLSQSSAKPVKVLYIINDLSIGGAEMMLYKLLAKTDRRRFDPVIISLMDQGTLRERIEALGIVVHTAGMKPGSPSIRGLCRLIGLIRRLRPDIILGWMYHSCLAAQLAGILSSRRTPVLWSIHTSISSLSTEKRLTAAVIKVCALLSRLPDKIIFVSRDGRAQHKLLGYRIGNSCVIPNGINVSQFTPSAEARLSVRSELGLPENAFLIGLAGRYHPMKDHSNFLRAAALLSKTHPGTHFLLSGRRVNRENHILCQSIQELGLTAHTHLLGERDDMPRLAAALDIFSLSSLYGESFPNVIGEAMACGVPSVVTDVGDAVWIVGDTGRVVPPGNPSALASAWKEIIDLGPEGRAVLGRAARSRVIDRFPLELAVARYETLYEDLLVERAPEKFAAAAQLEPAELSSNYTSDAK
jgi:glycosyltransferase involved in cell wall biosynthesis